jgi:hypothetical protein
MDEISDEEIVKAILDSKTMSQACSKLSMKFNSFKRKAKALGLYSPNPGGKGTNKPSKKKIPIEDILKGSHPQYQTFKLKQRLVKENYFKNECSICGISEWNGELLPLELDHVDGDSTNHTIQNLRILCPNCHSQTETFRGKNKGKK